MTGALPVSAGAAARRREAWPARPSPRSRLTDLAARAQLRPATTSELFSDLQRLGYLERRADGTDTQAMVIFPPRRQAPAGANGRVAAIEYHWSQIVGPERFVVTCCTLQELLDTLTSSNHGT